MKYEQRKVLIRESDLSKINNASRFSNRRFYTPVNDWRIVSTEPVTQAWCEKRVTWYTLKNKPQLSHLWRHWPWPDQLLARLNKKDIWDKRYLTWLVRWTDTDTLEIRAGLNQPRSKLVWATIERGIGAKSKDA